MRRKAVTAFIASLGVAAAAADLVILVGTRQQGVVSASSSEGSGGSGATSPSTGNGSSSDGDAPSTDGSTSTDNSSGSDTQSTSGAFADGTYSGSTVSTEHGDVQVQVTVSGGKITEVTALKYPTQEQRSQSISQQAIPLLANEAVDAQSANISMVSGATETSEGFMDSLQDAINQAQAG